MRTRVTCALVLLAACSSPPGALTEADRAALRELSEEFSRQFVAGDWAAVAKLYTEHASLMPPGAPAVKGRSAAMATLAVLPKTTEMSFTLEEIDGRGDLAFVRGAYKMTMVIPGAEGPVVDKGKFLEIRRKQQDGRWLIAVDIFNSDFPPGAPAPEGGPPERALSGSESTQNA